MNNKGFTLVELTISMSILVIICALGFAALQTATSAVATAKSKAEVQDNVRDVLESMTHEISLASKRTDASLAPPLAPLVVTANPVAGSPVQVTFQVPLDGTARRWSQPITYRYINEDVNGNGRLDAGEDKDGDHVLTRRIVRREDLNANGAFSAGEQKAIGGANNISSATFVYANNVLTITLTASKLSGTRRDHPTKTTVTGRVYLQN